MKGLENYLKLFKSPEGDEVRRVRVSTLSRYYWCSPQAWLSALGVKSPPSTVMSVGTEIHGEIEVARKLTSYEKKFKDLLDEFFGSMTTTKQNEENVVRRLWYDQKTMVEMGEIVTHGIDDFKVTKEKEVDLIEYKTKRGYMISPVDLMPAIFQTKIYCWVLDPLLKANGYSWKDIYITFLKRDRKRGFMPIGEHQVYHYDPQEVEKKLAEIFDEWDRASKAKSKRKQRDILIPPKKWKCIHCPPAYKHGENPLGLRCPFQ